LTQLALLTAGSASGGVGFITTRRTRRSSGWWERQFSQRWPMPIEDLFDHLAEIVDDVEAIGNLDGLSGATCRALRIGRTPVACQDLYAGMRFEPAGQGGRRAILQQLDGAALFFIYQDGAVGPTTPLTPVIHPQHAWGSHRWQRGACDQPQQRRATGV
jgi:hypothetical protein